MVEGQVHSAAPNLEELADQAPELTSGHLRKLPFQIFSDRFEGAEHRYIGDQAKLRFPGAAAPDKLQLPNGLQLSYGEVLALGGDFYGRIGGVKTGYRPIPISGDSSGETFDLAFSSLAREPKAFVEAPAILLVMRREILAMEQAIKEGTEPSAAYAKLGDTLSYEWIRITLGRFLILALENWDHFGSSAEVAYRIGHTQAHKAAVDAASAKDPEATLSMLALAYAMNAFADHFLTDLFSAGHMRVPRSQLASEGGIVTGGKNSRRMHDEDSCYGLHVINDNGDSWVAYGDKRLLDHGNEKNLALAEEAVQRSADEIWDAFNSDAGAKPAMRALHLTPNLSALISVPTDTANGSPLFITTDSGVQVRADPKDRSCYRWVPGHKAPNPDLSACAAPNKFVFEPMLLAVSGDYGSDMQVTQYAPAGNEGNFGAGPTTTIAGVPASQILHRHGAQLMVADLTGSGTAELAVSYRTAEAPQQRLLQVCEMTSSGAYQKGASTLAASSGVSLYVTYDAMGTARSNIVELTADSSSSMVATEYELNGSNLKPRSPSSNLDIGKFESHHWAPVQVRPTSNGQQSIAILMFDRMATTLRVALISSDSDGSFRTDSQQTIETAGLVPRAIWERFIPLTLNNIDGTAIAILGHYPVEGGKSVSCMLLLAPDGSGGYRALAPNTHMGQTRPFSNWIAADVDGDGSDELVLLCQSTNGKTGEPIPGVEIQVFRYGKSNQTSTPNLMLYQLQYYNNHVIPGAEKIVSGNVSVSKRGAGKFDQIIAGYEQDGQRKLAVLGGGRGQRLLATFNGEKPAQQLLALRTVELPGLETLGMLLRPAEKPHPNPRQRPSGPVLHIETKMPLKIAREADGDGDRKAYGGSTKRGIEDSARFHWNTQWREWRENYGAYIIWCGEHEMLKVGLSTFTYEKKKYRGVFVTTVHRGSWSEYLEKVKEPQRYFWTLQPAPQGTFVIQNVKYTNCCLTLKNEADGAGDKRVYAGDLPGGVFSDPENSSFWWKLD